MPSVLSCALEKDICGGNPQGMLTPRSPSTPLYPQPKTLGKVSTSVALNVCLKEQSKSMTFAPPSLERYTLLSLCLVFLSLFSFFFYVHDNKL